MQRVKGKIAIVTGAAKGIGKETAKLLAREGAVVAVTDVDDEAGIPIEKDINNAGGTAKYWHLDVSKEDEVEKVFAEIEESFGPIGILVNNAGIGGVSKPTHELSEEEWQQVQDINVKGVFLCTKHVVPYMKKVGGGSIVNLSSIYGIVGAPDAPSYHAAKGAVRLMAKTDALIYAKDNIRVNSVHPGFIWTPMVENFLAEQGDVEEGKKQLVELHPIGRLGKPEEVAAAILYLASDESSFVTGSELVIDGGYTAR